MKSRKFKLVLLVFLFLAGAITATNYWDKAAQKNMPSQSFIGMFHAQGSRWRNISEDVTRYMQACCKTRQEAIALLRMNGFSVQEFPQPENLERSTKEAGFDHDQFIAGVRLPGLFRFWRFFTEYRVTVYLKNEEITGVYAVVRVVYP